MLVISQLSLHGCLATLMFLKKACSHKPPTQTRTFKMKFVFGRLTMKNNFDHCPFQIRWMSAKYKAFAFSFRFFILRFCKNETLVQLPIRHEKVCPLKPLSLKLNEKAFNFVQDQVRIIDHGNIQQCIFLNAIARVKFKFQLDIRPWIR